VDSLIVFGVGLFMVGLASVLSGINPERFRYIFSRGWEPRDAKELRVARISSVALGTAFGTMGVVLLVLGIYFYR